MKKKKNSVLDNLREKKRMHKTEDLFSESLQLQVLFDKINIIIKLPAKMLI